MKTSPYSIAAYIIGGLLAGLGIFAHALGLDPSPSMGKGRQIILIAGLGLVLLPWGFQWLIARFRESSAFKFMRADMNRKKSQTDLVVDSESRNTNPLWVAGISGLAIFILYAWFSSLGTWQTVIHPIAHYGNGFQPNNYYEMLATGFQGGHLYLNEIPPTPLLHLEDPYDPSKRANAAYMIDAILYDGKYFIYWGPIPAVMLLAVKSIVNISVADSVFVFGFMVACFIFKVMILVMIRHYFFGRSPAWLLGLGILTCGVVGPYMSMLVRGRIYEAATAGGEFFLLAGFYFAIHITVKDIATRDLVIAGILWGCAFGTRAILVLPIAAMSILLIIFFVKNRARSIRAATTATVGLVLPMIIFAAGLGWYNWARFQSPFEFGPRYQLTSMHLQTLSASIFSTSHIPQNLYNYLILPFRVSEDFPYLFSSVGVSDPPPPFSASPFPYFPERMSGFLVTSPILLFILVSPVLVILRNLLRRPSTINDSDSLANMNLKWIVMILAAAGFAGSFPILMYFWAGGRYTTDFISPFTLLAIIGLWIAYDHVLARRQSARYLTAMVALLFSYTFAINVLLSFTTWIDEFYLLNRGLVVYLRTLSVTIPKLLSKFIGW